MVTEVPPDKIVLEVLRLMLSATTAAVRVILQEIALRATVAEEAVIAVAIEVDGAAAHLVVADRHHTEEVAETEVAVVKTDALRSSVKVCAFSASKRAT